ncbi:hypothetical protein EV204_105176 [Tissierella praeacuta]|nr:hypothetical protein EV204_105176 [Tissierella praeacuta]
MNRYLGRKYYEEYEKQVDELAEKFDLCPHEVDDILKNAEGETFEEQIEFFTKVMSEYD